MSKVDSVLVPPGSRGRRVGAVLAALGVTASLGLMASTAQASPSERRQFTYQTSNAACTYGISGVYTPPWGYQSGGTTRSQYRGSAPCNRYWGRPAYHIAAKVALYGYTGSSWVKCVQTGNYYNTSTASQKGILVNWNSSQWCGASGYGRQTFATSAVKHGNGSWYGGTLFSGAG